MVGGGVKPGDKYEGKLKSLVGRFSVGKVVTHAAKLKFYSSSNLLIFMFRKL